MAFPTGTYTGAGGDLDVYINEVWSSKINDFAKSRRIVTPFFTDRSDELAGGGDTVHTGGLTEMTAYTKSNGAAVTLNSPTETDVDLVVDTYYEVSFSIEDSDQAKFLKSLNLQERLAKNAGYTAAMTLEDALITLFASFTDSVGASDQVILDSDIRKAIGIVEANTEEESDNGEFTFFIEKKVFWNQIAGISTYQLNINSPVNDPVSKRPMPTLYGVQVKLTSRIDYISGTTGRYNALAHKDAIHYAISPLPGQGGNYVRTQSNYVPQYVATLTTADIQFGVIMNRATWGVKILSSAS
jgi:hypothetical protein